MAQRHLRRLRLRALSLTQRLVLNVEDFLNDAAFKTLFDTGQDVRSSPSGTIASP